MNNIVVKLVSNTTWNLTRYEVIYFIINLHEE